MKIISKAFRKVLRVLPKSLTHEILYYRLRGKKLNLKNPRDLNEKIQYLIVYKYGKREGFLADKYQVKNYLKEQGYGKLVPKLYGVYDNANEIDIEQFPEKFVIKPNNGSGTVCVCKDKKNFDLESCKKKLNQALKKKFSDILFEYHYDYIEPKIICEEYLDNHTNKLPVDYKFYCFDGYVDCVLVNSNREEKLHFDYFDLDWKPLPYSLEKYKSSYTIEKPKKLKEMIKIAQDLSKGFPFVRIDLYEVNNKIYFGEFTFSPAGGMMYYATQEALNHFGDLLKLPEK